MTSSKQPPACGRASATGSAKDLGFPEAVDLAESRLTPLDGHFDDELLWEMNFEVSCGEAKVILSSVSNINLSPPLF